MLVEQEQAGALPFKRRVRLRLHLFVCKWCASYVHKVKLLDRFLEGKYKRERQKDCFEPNEIQAFKDRIRDKFTQ